MGEVAKEFKNTVSVSGIILTRVDGDGRGGAALSMKFVSQVPIKFLGIGEKIDNIEVFHPDRIANRILGMGDIVSLVEKAAQDLGEEKIKKMGGIEGVMSFMPGVSKIKSQMDQAGIDEKIVTQNEAVILSMTKKERENPKIIDGSRKKRIANGSGTDIATINKLLKQFKMMSDMMKKMSKGDTKGMSDKGIPPELFNQLKLRLSRGGTKKRPVYKVVVADSRFARDGRFIEKVGFFNPLLPKEKKERIGLEAERIKYWLGQGAQPTTRVARILGENELMPMPVNGNNPQKAIPKKERKKENSSRIEEQSENKSKKTKGESK